MINEKMWKRVAEILRWIFGISLTLIYISIAITMIGLIGVLATMVEGNMDFRLDLFFFFGGCSLFAIGCAFLGWIYLMIWYQRVFDKLVVIMIPATTIDLDE